MKRYDYSVLEGGVTMVPSESGEWVRASDLESLFAVLRAISEGCEVSFHDDRYVVVENPNYRPDDGSDPNLVVDVDSLGRRSHAWPPGVAPRGTKPELIRPDRNGHRTRFSDSSFFDEVCVVCGATDGSSDGRLNRPCPGPIR